ncbi:hypothetical protein GW17_00022022 [Ensete ventricosum]|nr:hypothetical protein GW17_00022022 [Ensete ventricosum]
MGDVASVSPSAKRHFVSPRGYDSRPQAARVATSRGRPEGGEGARAVCRRGWRPAGPRTDQLPDRYVPGGTGPYRMFSSQRYDTTSSLGYSSQTREYEQGSGTEWLHMQVGGTFERVT